MPIFDNIGQPALRMDRLRQPQPVYSENWTTLRCRMDDGQRAHWQFLVQNFAPPRDARHVLDFGCANGELSDYLLKNFPWLRITAIDIDHGLVETTKEKLFGYDSVKWSAICGSAFDLDPREFDLIYFNPPMVPNEAGFYGFDNEWCLLQYLEWSKISRATNAIMLFDYCHSLMTSDGETTMSQLLLSHGFSIVEHGREPRIVHDASPVWQYQSEIKGVFPRLRFQTKVIGEQEEAFRVIDRIAYVIQQKVRSLKP